jgi:hypothetical protein
MRKRHVNDCLTIRYQYSENIATLKVLLPAVAGYGVMIVLGVGVSIYAFMEIYRANQNSINVQIAFQILYMIADLYGVYFIAYIFLKFRPMNLRLRKHVRWLLKLPISAANTINPFQKEDPKYVSDFYFKQLAEAWNQSHAHTHEKPTKKPGKNKKMVYQATTSTREESSVGKSQIFLG